MSLRMSEAEYRRVMGLPVSGRQAMPSVTKQPRREKTNKTECAYIRECIEPFLATGELLWYGYERTKLVLADKTTYLPDFHLIWANGEHEFVEIKGFIRDDALVKWKIAAEMFPWARWSMIRKGKDGWETLRFRDSWQKERDGWLSDGSDHCHSSG